MNTRTINGQQLAMLQMIELLNRDGFCLVREAVAAARIKELSDAIAEVGASFGLRNLLRTCPRVSALARDLTPLAAAVMGEKPFVVRGLFFDKLPEANWEVPWHQDLSIAVAERCDVAGFTGWSVKQGVVHTQPPVSVLEEMLTMRIHLDDCGAKNGPLRVLAGSHREGRLNESQIERWKSIGRQTVCDAPAGSALLMKPLLLHASSRAKNPRHRRVVHLEYAVNPLPEPLQWFEQSATSKNET